LYLVVTFDSGEKVNMNVPNKTAFDSIVKMVSNSNSGTKKEDSGNSVVFKSGKGSKIEFTMNEKHQIHMTINRGARQRVETIDSPSALYLVVTFDSGEKINMNVPNRTTFDKIVKMLSSLNANKTNSGNSVVFKTRNGNNIEFRMNEEHQIDIIVNGEVRLQHARKFKKAVLGASSGLKVTSDSGKELAVEVPDSMIGNIVELCREAKRRAEKAAEEAAEKAAVIASQKKYAHGGLYYERWKREQKTFDKFVKKKKRSACTKWFYDCCMAPLHSCRCVAICNGGCNCGLTWCDCGRCCVGCLDCSEGACDCACECCSNCGEGLSGCCESMSGCCQTIGGCCTGLSECLGSCCNCGDCVGGCGGCCAC
jgi:hypothetical protein